MDLHQIQLIYQEDDDRVLFRATFKQQAGNPLEFRAWFTRRFVKILWPGISATFQAQVKLNQPQAAHASAAIVNMENEAAINEIKADGNFNTPFESSEHLYPLGELPILVTNVQFTLKANQPVRIHFTNVQKTGLDMSFTPALLHGFCSLLQLAVKEADWKLELQLPGTPPSNDAPRTLN